MARPLRVRRPKFEIGPKVGLAHRSYMRSGSRPLRARSARTGSPPLWEFIGNRVVSVFELFSSTEEIGLSAKNLSIEDSGVGRDSTPDQTRPVVRLGRRYDQGRQAQTQYRVGVPSKAAIKLGVRINTPEILFGDDAVAGIHQAGDIVSVPDQGSGADLLASEHEIPTTDSGTMLDASDVLVSSVVQAVETITGPETVSVRVRFTRIDAGSGLDQVHASPGEPVGNVSDSGTFADSVGDVVAQIEVEDAALAADSVPAALVDLDIVDSVSGADFATVTGTALVAILEQALAVEGVQVIAVTVPIPERGFSVDAISQVLAAVAASDAGQAVDFVSINEHAGAKVRRLKFVFHSRRQRRFEF